MERARAFLSAQEAAALFRKGRGQRGQRVEGELALDPGEVFQLPDDLEVEYLNLKGSATLTCLPCGLRCYELNLAETKIASLPADLRVESILDLSNCEELTALPAGLQVGSLVLRGCRSLEALPEDLTVWFLDMTGCWSFRSWPKRATIRSGRVNLRGCAALTSLPEYLGPLAALNVRDCPGLRSLPEGLRITGWIDVAQSGLAEVKRIPKSLCDVEMRWQGVRVEPRVILQPETITVAEILAETNAERRRVLLDRFGYPRFMTETRAELLDEDTDPGGPRRLLRGIAGGRAVGDVVVLLPIDGAAVLSARAAGHALVPPGGRVDRRLRRAGPVSTAPGNLRRRTVTISENASVFYQLPVQDFQGEDDWHGIDIAYRLRTGWDDEPDHMRHPSRYFGPARGGPKTDGPRDRHVG